MPQKTKIEYADYSSNPIVPVGGGWGCSKVSPGCLHCYAERLNKRLGNGRDFTGKWEFEVKEAELAKLRKLKGGYTIFLGDMTDIFHPDVPFSLLARVFAVMMASPQHTFQVLTKRPGRMAYFANVVLPWHGGTWPDNVWAMTSVEEAKYLPRLDLLARVPAKVRGVSLEPLLGPVDLRPWLCCEEEVHFKDVPATGVPDDAACPFCCGLLQTLQWVVLGAETGPGARPMEEAWARSIKNQCVEAGVPFFLKAQVVNGKRVSLPQLDGRTWEEVPS